MPKFRKDDVKMANRTRTNRNEFHLDDKEQFILDEKFRLSGMKSKSAENVQGLAEKNQKENQRGLGILPYGNFIIRTVGKYGEFRLCVRT